EFLKRNPAHRQALGTRVEIASKAGDTAVEGTILMRLARVLIDTHDLERAREVLPRLTALRPGDMVVQGLREELEHPGSSTPARTSVPVAPDPVATRSAVPEAGSVVGDAEE